MHTRKAILPDTPYIQELIALNVQVGALLPRNIPDICEHIRDFVVVEDAGQIIGCGALHLYGTHLAEIRSVSVHPSYQGKGAGRRLIKALLQDAARHHVTGVCLFTRIPEYFAQLGFGMAELTALPDKIYKDCLQCPRLSACDEVAMIKGEVPKVTVLEQARMFARPIKLNV